MLRTHRFTLLRKITAIGALSSLALVVAGCSSNSSHTSTASQSSPSEAAVSFMLDWTANTNHIGLYVAQSKGYYQKEGVKLTILPTAQAGAETSVENGVADIGFTTLSNVAAFNAKGAHLKFVFDLTQKQVARWCALASRTDIQSPKDFSGKTFVSFGSAEQSAVLREMIKHAGGSGDFKSASVGTGTFQTLTSSHGDFAGFYETWEGVQSRLEGPTLKCFIAGNWGVPGNPDQLGFAVKESWLKDKTHQETLKKFLKATKEGYNYALAHPDESADILVKDNPQYQISTKLAKASMQDIIEGTYWTTNDPKHLPGTVNFDDAQQYLNFQYKAGTYTDNNGKVPSEAPQAKSLATNAYVK